MLAVCAPAYILSIVAMIGASQFADRDAVKLWLILLHVVMRATIAGVTLTSTNIALKLSPKGSATAYVAANAMVTALAAGLAPILGGLLADFFAARRFELVARWTGPRGDLPLPIALTQWDFYFLIAGIIGVYAIHRLSLIQEHGATVTLSDAILVFRHEAPPHERESVLQFVQMLGAVYTMLELPPVEHRDWMARAERTARDLDEAPEATIRHYGHRYVHPYTAAEYPDVMVQMSVVTALHDWGVWRGEPHPLEAELKAGLSKFHDTDLGTLRRYLPNVGKDKNADAVDSWYLYHPMVNLGFLALDGDAQARALFLDTIGFGIKAARHFHYVWPVQYDVTDFSVVEQTAPVDGRG